MTRELKGAVVVVAGASSGIGRASALCFARAGARVALAARVQEPLEDVAAECAALGVEAAVVPTDVCNEREVQALSDTAVARFGSFQVSAYATSKFAVRASSQSTGGRTLSPVVDDRAYAIYGGWKRARRGDLVRAVLAALGGLVRGLFGGRA